MKKLLISLLLVATVASATSLESLIERNSHKVVKIGVIYPTGAGVGSGAFIDSHGLVLTCAHLFTHGKFTKIYVKKEDESFVQARIVLMDMVKDLALLQPEGLDNTPFFVLGDSPKIGQQVISFGSPLGIQHMVTIGWVGNIVNKGKRLIFHSAFINPGNSGGPLVNLKGQLVGINAMLPMVNPFVPANGLNIAIDVSEINIFLRSL